MILQLFKHSHIRTADGQGHDGNETAAQDCVRINVHVAAFLKHILAPGQIQIVLLGDEIVGEVRAALAGDADVAGRGRNIDIVDGVLLQELALCPRK